MHRRTKAVVYLSRIKQNLKNLKLQSGASELCMMVKANAYGHGAGPVAKGVESEVERFGVVSIEEAIAVRKHGVKKPILLFSNLWEDSVESLVEYSITPVIGSLTSLSFLKKSNIKIPFHIKLNTGMNRFGFKMEDLSELKLELEQMQDQLEGFCSHLLAGGDYNDSNGHSKKQVDVFFQMMEQLNIDRAKHFYKSAPPLLVEAGECDDVLMKSIRPGIACYGVRPEQSFKSEWELSPALELKTLITAVQKVKLGESVSYSANWVAKRDSKVAVIQIGYADGLHRSLSNKLKVIVGGKLLPQIGNICMDYCMIDVTDLERDPVIGEEVVIYGSQENIFQGVEEVAVLAGTIPYELLTSLSMRVNRVYIE